MSSSSSPTLVPVASALVERLGTDAATLRSWRRRNSKRSEGASSGCGNGRDEEEQQQEGPRPVAARDVRAALAAALPSLGLKGGNSRSRSISSINGSKSNSNDGGDSNQDLFACGHRIVHGGELSASKEWPGEGGGGDNDNDDDDNSTRAAVAAATPLAPLHNPRNAEAADAALELFPEATHVAVFDTAFHVASLPEEAYTYALPRSMRTLGGGGGGGSVNNNSSSSSSSSSPSPIPIRKYGFHGSSFRHAVRAASELLGLPLPPPRPPSSSSSSPPSSREEEQDDAIDAVAFHLGAGASAAAIRNGKSVDTSLGATPLQGLVMATRCGDVDPAVPLMVAAEWERREREGGASTTSSPPSSSKSNSKSSSSVVERVLSSLNKEAGLVALAGPGVAPTGDMRDVIAAAAEGGGGGGGAKGGEKGGGKERDAAAAASAAAARLALSAYVYRIRHYLGAYLLGPSLRGKADAIIFTGGVGENSPLVRARVLEGLESWGIEVDAARNEAAVGVREAVRIDAYADSDDSNKNSNSNHLHPKTSMLRKGCGIAIIVVPADEEAVIARDAWEFAVLKEKRKKVEKKKK